MQKPTTECAHGVPDRKAPDTERSAEDDERVAQAQTHGIGGGDEIAPVAHADEAELLLKQDEKHAESHAGERANEGDEIAFGDKDGAHPRSGHAEVAECAHVVPLFEDHHGERGDYIEGGEENDEGEKEIGEELFDFHHVEHVGLLFHAVEHLVFLTDCAT